MAHGKAGSRPQDPHLQWESRSQRIETYTNSRLGMQNRICAFCVGSCRGETTTEADRERGPIVEATTAYGRRVDDRPHERLVRERGPQHRKASNLQAALTHGSSRTEQQL